MTEIIRKKLNLLAHLAKIDGQFDDSERKILVEMLAEVGVSVVPDADELASLDDVQRLDRIDVLYWALRMIKADGVLHSDELAYCKALALKLGFSVEIIDYFTENDLPKKTNFKNQAKLYITKSA